MAEDELLTKVKTALRVTVADTDLDDEINSLILAARADLKVNGIVSDAFAESQKDLIEQAIKIYCKAHFGFDNPDAPRLLESYEGLVNHLSVHSQFAESEAVNAVD
ncbi:hypothetical protein OfM1_18880 [Lactovum odontotermitis]